MTTAGELSARISEQGFAGPVPVLSSSECRHLLQMFNKGRLRSPLDWPKGFAASSPAFYEIGTHPSILEVVTALLGKDILLWGASWVSRSPDEIHHWHTDIESCSSEGRTIGVWVGIENCSSDSCLSMISYSHLFGAPVQRIRHEFRKGREETSTDDIIRWAQIRDRRAGLQTPEIRNGNALFFDGRLWHYSHNHSTRKRHALLLQYSTPDTVIRIPAPNQLDWPFNYLNQPKPPCVIVKGSDGFGVNRIVKAPVSESDGSDQKLTSYIYPLQIPLSPDPVHRWKYYPVFRGSTACLPHLSCHISVLSTNHSPHPPHQHHEEEILFLLSGEVEIILPDWNGSRGPQRKRLFPGQFVYYPAHFAHTLQTVSADPANYVMFKWSGDVIRSSDTLGFGQFSIASDEKDNKTFNGFSYRILLEGPTDCLRKLQCHRSTLSPGSGYDPHVDAYDAAILVLEGEIETHGERVGPNTIIFNPAGEFHGMRNPGDVPAKYVVFEFHVSGSHRRSAHPNRKSSFLTKLTDPSRWKRKIKRLLRKIEYRRYS